MSSIPRTPLTQAHFARLFFAYNFSTVNYSKIPFTPEQHITLLESRKLIIEYEGLFCYALLVRFEYWPYRLTVRTHPSQGWNQSSILCGVKKR